MKQCDWNNRMWYQSTAVWGLRWLWCVIFADFPKSRWRKKLVWQIFPPRSTDFFFKIKFKKRRHGITNIAKGLFVFGYFVPLDLLSPRTFFPMGICPKDVLSLRTFCPCGRFVLTDVLSHERFAPWTFCPTELFCLWMFCFQTFCLRTFCLQTFCFRTFCTSY
jgi:hypothetical protein